MKQSWGETVKAAEAVGAKMTLEEDDTVDFALPEDGTFFSYRRHPPHQKSCTPIYSKGGIQTIQGKKNVRVSLDQFLAANHAKSDLLRARQQWTESEMSDFIKHLKTYGKKWAKIASLIGTKSDEQVKQYYQTYRSSKNFKAVLQERISTPHNEGAVSKASPNTIFASTTVGLGASIRPEIVNVPCFVPFPVPFAFEPGMLYT